MINSIKEQVRGFTLIETLVAVLLLTVAIAGPLTIVSRSLVTSLVARNQVIAFFLAQDAIEFVRFARDTNQLSDLNWFTGGSGGYDLSLCQGDGCYVDSAELTIDPCSGTCPTLLYDTDDSLFGYGSGDETIFQRTINIATPVGSNTDEALVEVVVEWSDTAGITRNVTVRENIFNWQ